MNGNTSVVGEGWSEESYNSFRGFPENEAFNSSNSSIRNGSYINEIKKDVFQVMLPVRLT